jgi:hypothetical protein
METEILDVKKLLSKKPEEVEKNSLIEVDLGNLVAFDFQEYRAGFDTKAITYTHHLFCLINSHI